MHRGVGSVAFVALLLFIGQSRAASRVEDIRARGYMTCGVSFKVPGFASLAPDGRVLGFEPDLCRAVAAAILGISGAVRFVPAESVETFVATGEPDLVARRLTVTLRRDLAAGGAFSPVVFYDGAALLVHGSKAIGSPLAYSGWKLCVAENSETETSVVRYFRAHGTAVEIVSHGDLAEGAKAFMRGECTALAGDLSEIAAVRAGVSGNDKVSILPTLLSKEPLALFMHGDDAQFAAVVRWTIYALIEAEELGVTRDTVGAARGRENPAVRLLLGDDPGNGAALGLDERWAANALATVGNYGEIFSRNLGNGSTFRLARGMNALWRDGGLMYSLPLR
jgi:general L-amino acid transport system substrate-binding protein